MLGLSLSSSTLNGPGALTVSSRGLSLINSTINTSVTDNGPLNVTGVGTINGSFSIGTTGVLTVGVALGCANSADLTVANGFTNQGQISLRSSFVCDRGSGTLRVSSGTLVNDTGGNHPVQRSDRQRALVAGLDNRGTLDAPGDFNIQGSLTNAASGKILVGAELDLSLVGNASFTNIGTLDVASGKTLFVGQGTFNNEGSLTGGGTLSFSSTTLNFTPNFTTDARVGLSLSSGSTLNGPGASP